MCAALLVDYALSLSGFPVDVWNTWAADSGFYTSHAWLRMVESDGEARAGYLIARRGDTPVGALPVYESVAEGNPAYRTQTLLDGRWQGTYLLAGTRRAYANAVLVAPDLDAADRRTVVATLVDEARGLARRRGHAGVVFLYLTTDAAQALRSLPGVEDPYVLDAEAVLDLPGTGVDDYHRGLPGRQRQNVRREDRVFSTSGLVARIEPLTGCWRDAGVLLANLQRRYGRNDAPERWQRILQRQATGLGDVATVFTARAADALVGFCLAYPFGDGLYARVTGFDYAAQRRVYEYPNLVFYRPISFCYERGLRRIHFGRGSHDAKVRRGARLRPLWGCRVPVDATRAESSTAVTRFNRHCGAGWRSRYGAALHAAEWPL